MSCMSQNFRLFHESNLSVRNFRIFLLMCTGSGPAVPAGFRSPAPVFIVTGPRQISVNLGGPRRRAHETEGCLYEGRGNGRRTVYTIYRRMVSRSGNGCCRCSCPNGESGLSEHRGRLLPLLLPKRRVRAERTSGKTAAAVTAQTERRGWANIGEDCCRCYCPNGETGLNEHRGRLLPLLLPKRRVRAERTSGKTAAAVTAQTERRGGRAPPSSPLRSRALPPDVLLEIVFLMRYRWSEMVCVVKSVFHESLDFVGCLIR